MNVLACCLSGAHPFFIYTKRLMSFHINNRTAKIFKKLPKIHICVLIYPVLYSVMCNVNFHVNKRKKKHNSSRFYILIWFTEAKQFHFLPNYNIHILCAHGVICINVLFQASLPNSYQNSQLVNVYRLNIYFRNPRR